MARRKKKLTNTKKHYSHLLFIGFFMVCFIAVGLYNLLSGYGSYAVTLGKESIDPNLGIRAQVEEFFTANNAPEMIPIIKCESRFRHYNQDGTVLHNRAGSSAIGVAQILSSAHPDPKVLESYNRRYNAALTVEDFDITSLEGNLAYALVLYEVRGTRDWECSKKFRFAV